MKKHQQDADWHEMNLWEYILLANPDEAVHEKVMSEKKYLEDKYETDIATKTLPHITIANFLAKEMIENRICHLLQNICNLNYSFTIALNNFSGFPSHAVFIRVQNPQPFKHLHNGLQALDNFLKTNECPPLQLAAKPHMTIARQLPEEIYNAAIKEYAEREFHEQFTVDKLVLLKRDTRYKKWQHVNYFYLPPERNLFN
jgi:2'-5' RNA ligase